jgi:hypothetical protein
MSLALSNSKIFLGMRRRARIPIPLQRIARSSARLCFSTASPSKRSGVRFCAIAKAVPAGRSASRSTRFQIPRERMA